MRTHMLTRRRMLRGLLVTGGAVAVPLPIFDGLLNSKGTAFAADGAPLPRRYVTWFFGNGVLPPRWVPAATGDTWTLSDQLAPLTAVKDNLTVISGLARKVPGTPHPDGSAAATTGAIGTDAGAQLPSIDQIAADAIAGTTLFRSLEVGVTAATPNGPQPTLHSVSHRGPNQALRPEFDPRNVFKRLFSVPAGTDAAAIEKLLAARRSVLDTVLADARDLSGLLGARDKARLEAHLEGIRALEARLVAPPNSCVRPATPTRGADAQNEAPPEVNTIMTELVALAFACGLTNVVTYTFSLPAAHVYYRHLATNMNDDFHDTICHLDTGDASSQPRVHTGVLYTMKCLAEFLQKLKTTPEGTDNLLHNSLVYVTSCTAWGKIHTAAEWPVLLAGKAGGRIKGNQHLKFPGENLSRALLTVAKLVGSPVSQIGKAEGLATAMLPGLQIA